MTRTPPPAVPFALFAALRAFVARPSTPRLLIPAAALALILALPLSADPVLWMALCGAGAALVACDVQRGAGRRAGYLAAAALVGLVVSPDGFSRIAPGLIALGAALPPLAFALAYAGRQGAQPAPVSAPVVPLMRGADDELMTRLYVTTDGMVKAAQAIKEVASQQSSGALEQVDVIHVTNHKVEDFMTLAAQVSDETSAMTRTAHDAADIARGGQRALDQVLEGMGQISAQVAAIGATIVQLAQLARRIDEIINSVGEIATQSNLLALNASIEAARAGAGGRGFAVVADEVRALARQSTSAAGQIRAILGEIQAAVKQTVTTTEVGVALADDGMEAARSAHQVMSRLAANVIQSYEAIKTISGAIREQADRMDEISISLARIEQITQQNLVSTRVVDRISGNLTQLSDELGSVRPAVPELA